MQEQTPTGTVERKETFDDNARKFTLPDSIDRTFLANAHASLCTLVTDWIVTEEQSERKIVLKKFDNGEQQRFLIQKISTPFNRTTQRKLLTETEYAALRASSVLRMKKRRFEFVYTQNGTDFTLKYDEFPNNSLRILEVDAPTDEVRRTFKPEQFPFKMKEVTEDPAYRGYRITEILGVSGAQ